MLFAAHLKVSRTTTFLISKSIPNFRAVLKNNDFSKPSQLNVSVWCMRLEALQYFSGKTRFKTESNQIVTRHLLCFTDIFIFPLKTFNAFGSDPYCICFLVTPIAADISLISTLGFNIIYFRDIA